MLAVTQWVRSLFINQEQAKLKQELAKIVMKYKERGWEYEQNNAYHMGGNNVGSDMLEACYYTEEIINNTRLSKDYNKSCLLINERIMDNLSDYESTHRDSNGYGSSTVQEIAIDIKALVE
jgi:hypothetical protein